VPKKPIDKLRVPLNCLIAPATKAAITEIQNGTKESQGETVDRAIALLAFGEEVSQVVIPPAKASAKPGSRESWDLTAQTTPTPRRTGSIRGIRPKGDKGR
jgi:hypothetical protein